MQVSVTGHRYACIIEIIIANTSFVDVRNLVSQRTLSHFSEDLKKRRQFREKQVKQARQRQQEKDREEQIQKERELERARERRAEMEMMQSAFTPLSSIPAVLSTSPPYPLLSSSPSTDEGEAHPEPTVPDEEDKGFSFAQALMGQQQKKKPKMPALQPGQGKNKNKQILFTNSGSRGYR